MNYYIHDNGGRPFKVFIDKDGIIKIYKQDNNLLYNIEILEVNDYNELFIGYDPLQPNNNGHSILIKINKHNYIYIGYEIYKFITDDEITHYISIIGNNDVPYPYAVGRDNIYLMIESKYFDKTLFSPYTLYYRHSIITNDIKKYVIHSRIC
jgi:hypothetical protein